MIYLITDQHTPKIAYATLVLGKYLWGTSIEAVLVADLPEDRMGIWLNYSSIPIAGSFSVYNSGWLHETQLPTAFAPVSSDLLPRLFPAPQGSTYDWDYDVLAAIVWLTTEAEYSVEVHLDPFGRYDQSRYPSHQLGLETQPLLAIYAQALAEALGKRYGDFPRSRFEPSTLLTIDIDFPWKYAHKPWYVSIGSAIKALGREPTREVMRRVVPPANDPFYTFDVIQDLCQPEKTIFFALIERRSRYDSWFTARLNPYRELLVSLRHQGYSLGIHPSFRSSEQEDWLREEIVMLNELLGESVTGSRQHFLRYRTPDTYRWLIRAGILRDYGLYRHGTGGFPAGMVRAFPWFDLERNEVTDLMLQPTMLMDRTMLSHLQLEPEAAFDYVSHVWERCRTYGGTFTFLFHNDSLSEVGEWTGWKAVLSDIIRLLQES